MNTHLRAISLAVIISFLLTSAFGQDRLQQNDAAKAKRQASVAAQASNTPGRIAKFTDNKFLGDSNITEDDSGRIGIGTTLPTSTLTVNGIIEMQNAGSGIKFADGTLQTTAGIAAVNREATLKGNGTPASPLGLAVPLTLTGGVTHGSVFVVSNTNVGGTGISGNAGPGEAGVRGRGGNSDIGGSGMVGQGGTSTTYPGGPGVVGNAGDSNSGDGGAGVIGNGGDSNSDEGGTGVSGQGGRSANGNGGKGVRAVGGWSAGAGTRGGTGLEVFGGPGVNGGADGMAANMFGNVQVSGNVNVTGVLSKGGGSFKIDHPLDPENKYLSHSFVESPDMMNIYNGNITTGADGEATVTLPDWFEALNKDFRYQLTVIGTFAQAIVAEKVKDNRFVIKTSAPGVEVSWQVTGIRKDAWANKNRIPVEEEKPELERGHYLYPEAFGKTEERGVEWAKNPKLMREVQQRRLEANQMRSPRQ